MGPHRELRLMTFGVARALAVVVAFLIFALLPSTVKGFTLVDFLDQFVTARCAAGAAQAWNDCLKDNNCDLGFDGGIGSGGPFFSLSVEVPKALYRYTYGDEHTNSRATILIRANDLAKLPKWRSHAIETHQTLYVEYEGRWDVSRASGPIGGFPGNLHFEFGNTGLICVVPVFRN